MNKFRQFMKERSFIRLTFFIVFTATLLYIMYFVVKDFPSITGSVFSVIGSIVSALSPLWIGLILAYIINPLVETIDLKLIGRLGQPDGATLSIDSSDETLLKKRRKRTRFISIIITYLIIVAALILLLYLFAAMIVGRFVVTSLPNLLTHFVQLAYGYEDEFRNWIANLPDGVLSDYATSAINTVMEWLSAHFSASGVISTISSIGSGILNFALGIVVSIYLIADKDFFIGLWNKLITLITPKRSSGINGTLREVDDVLSKFLRGVLLDAICVAVLSSIGLSIIGLEFSVVIGIFAGVANVIPYFGPIIGMVPAFLVGLFTDGIWKGILAVIVLIILQQIDANLIYPRIVGSSIGLKPIFVLLAVSFGGYYGGIVGMILAVPAASILQLFIIKWAGKREQNLASKQPLQSSADDSDNLDANDLQ